MKAGFQLVFGVCVAFAVAFSFACEPGPGVDFDNQRREELIVYLDGEEVLSVPPGETKHLVTKKGLWPRHVRITTLGGEVVFDEELAWEDLKQSDFEIVVAGE